MLKFFPLLVTAVLALPGPLLAQDAGAVLRIIEAQDQIVRIQAKTRHTTVIVLPAAEDILDFVVGDSEYWHLTGAANLAFLKPIAEDVTTNVALVCASGRIYSFLVTEESAGEPHLIVRVEHPQIDDPRISPGVNTPAFVRRSQVTAYQEMAETAMQTVATVQEEAEVRVAEAKALAEGETEAFRSDYPTRLNFPYAWRTRRSNGRSWSRECGMTGNLLTFAPTPRRRPRSTKKRTANRRWLPTILKKTACISPAMF